jgi:hypothetical protein
MAFACLRTVRLQTRLLPELVSDNFRFCLTTGAHASAKKPSCPSFCRMALLNQSSFPSWPERNAHILSIHENGSPPHTFPSNSDYDVPRDSPLPDLSFHEISIVHNNSQGSWQHKNENGAPKLLVERLCDPSRVADATRLGILNRDLVVGVVSASQWKRQARALLLRAHVIFRP